MADSLGQAGLDIIKSYEQGPEGGFAQSPYADPIGKMTVGYGHLLRGSDKFKFPLTEQQAEDLLLDDIAEFEAYLNNFLEVELTQNQYDACLSLMFNIGPGHFRSSTLLRMINEGLITESASQFPRWRKAGGAILPGLVRRRKEEMELFLS